MSFKVSKGFDISKLDQSAVKQAQRGSGWDQNDQARYDAIIKSRQPKSAPKPASKRAPANNTPPKPQAQAKQRGQTYLKHNNSTPAPTPPKPPAANKKPAVADNKQTQTVTQDNDINTNITGDNNKVFNEQDNSIRQYGGDNRTFVYNAGQQGDGFSKYAQTPVSAATMSGFYAPDDSPAAQAKFTDLHSTLNADKQKRYAGDAMKVANKYMMDARDYTNESMENYLNKSIQYSYDRADRQTGATFGDIWNPNYITEDWKMPEAPKAIESNASKIAEDAKKDIEDI